MNTQQSGSGAVSTHSFSYASLTRLNAAVASGELFLSGWRCSEQRWYAFLTLAEVSCG